MKKLIALSLFSLLPLAATVHAETIAVPSQFDPRTRYVNYNPMQVYKITGYYGYFTRIEFSKDEKDLKVAMGDEEAWKHVAVGNNLLIKPTAPEANTNMVVITSDRSYNFVLNSSAKEPSGDTINTAHIVPNANSEKSMPNPSTAQQYLIVFRYPNAEAAAKRDAKQKERDAAIAKAKAEEAQMQAAMEKFKVRHSLKMANNTVVNTDYFACGDVKIQPEAIYDNSKFTYIKFPASATIPSFFIEDARNGETLVNYNVEDDWVIIHRIFKTLILRDGKSVGCIVNGSEKTTRTDTGTLSPTVTREIIVKPENNQGENK